MTISVSGDVHCTECRQGYNPEFITEEGLCDWCDQERLEALKFQHDQKEWDKLSPEQREKQIKWHGNNPG
jgi:hypothetical protein